MAWLISIVFTRAATAVSGQITGQLCGESIPPGVNYSHPILLSERETLLRIFVQEELHFQRLS